MKPSKYTKGLFPGSFDPVTLGHLDIVSRFACLFESLTVLVASSLQKAYWFSLKEREALAQEAFKDFSNVTVDSHQGLTADYAREHDRHIILRGIRSISDFAHERDIALNNRRMLPSLETLFVFASSGKELISSRLIKEIATHGGDLSELVPEAAIRYIKQKLNPAKC